MIQNLIKLNIIKKYVLTLYTKWQLKEFNLNTIKKTVPEASASGLKAN